MASKKSKHGAVPQVVRIEPLELRVLYSAELAPFLVLNDSANEPTLEPVAKEDWLKPTETDSPLNANTASSSIVTELVIVDSSQSDIDELEQLLESQLGQQNQVKLITLDAKEDALEAITQILSQYSNLNAVHIISHATEGAIQLGSQTLDQSDLVLNSDLVKQWGSSFSDGGDLLLYGCNLSATDDGREFAKTLSALTETDVASSSDITGHALRDGNWDLEVSEGQIETAVIAGDQLQDDWIGILDTTNGLIHHWALDGNGTDSVAISNFSLINGVGSPTGLIGQAGDFSENTTSIKHGFVQSGLSPNFGTNDFGIAFWMHVDSANDGARMFGDLLPGNTGYSLTLDANGRVVFTVENASSSHVVVGSEAVTDSDWRHVTATRIGGTLELIVYNKATNTFDKQIFNSGESAVALTNYNLLRMGTADDTVGDYDGLLDDIRLYDRALTDKDSADLVASVVSGEIIVNNQGATVYTGLPTLITSTELLTVSNNVPVSQIEYLITTNSTGHQFYVSGVPVPIGSSFSQQDINNHVVTILGDGTADSIPIKVNDGQGNATYTAFDIYPGVAGNTAPTAGSALLSVSEDDTDPAGTTVFELIDPTFTDPDAGDSLAGILVSDAAVDSTEGLWQYSTDNGVAWHDVGIANSANALALSATTELRFLPAPNFSGTPAGMSFHAVQSFAGSTTAPFTYTSGSIRAEMPVTPNGGMTAISAGSELVDVTVTALDDPPTISMISNTIDVAESESVGTIIGSVNASDVDSGDTLTIDILDAVSGLVSSAVGVNNLNQLELLSELDFETQTNPQLIARVTDSAGLSDSVPFTVNILDVNEPPQAIAPAVIDDVDEDDTNSAGQRVSDIFSSSFSDPDGQSFWGIAIVGHESTSPSGHWEYQIGTGWYSVGITSTSYALVLHEDTYLRFVPAQNYSGPVSDLSFHVIDSAYIGGAVAPPVYIGNLFTMHVDHVSPTAEIATGKVLPINDPPTDLYSTLGLAVSEDAAVGQSVGFVSGVDFDSTDLTYALLANAGGRFAIEPQTGEVTLVSAADIDHETNSFHQITVEVSDPENAKYQENLLVHVLDVDEAPTLIAPVVLNAVMEDDTNPLGQTVNALFSPVFDDVDDDDSLGGIAIVQNNAIAAEGLWQYYDGAGWIDVSGVSTNNALVLSTGAQLRFLPAAGYVGPAGTLLAHAIESSYISSNGSAAHFNSNLFNATNPSVSASGVSVSSQVLPVNDAPHALSSAVTLSVAEDAALNQSVGVIAGADVDDVNLTYSLVANAGGRFSIDATSGEVSLVSPADIDHETNSFHQITVQVADPSNATFQEKFTVQVIDVNEQPTLAGPVVMSSVLQDSVDPAGQNVAAIFSGQFDDQDDGDFLGGVVIAQNNALSSEGTWQFNDNAGAGWIDIATVSASTVLVLDNSTELRFLPEPGFTGSPGGLSVYALDNHYVPNPPVSGSHYSSATVFSATNSSISTNRVDVSLVVIDNLPPHSLSFSQTTPLDEGAPFGQIVGVASGADVDDTDLTYALVADAGGRFAIDGSTGVVSVLSPTDLDHEVNSFHQITVQVADPSNQVLQQNFMVQVGDVNERPSLLSAVTMNTVLEDETNPQGESVVDIFASVFDDVDDGDSLGGVAIVADNSVISEGEWQFYDGSAWNSIPSVSVSNALVLSADSMLRFLPATGYVGGVGHLLTHALDSAYFSTAASTGAHINTNLFSATNSSISSSGVAVNQLVLPVNDAPSNIVASSTLLVVENTPGVSISTMSGVDVDDTNLVYALTNDAGGRLEIDAITGELSLSAGVQLDYESQSTHPIRVEVRDPSGASFEKNYTVTVLDLPERPSLIANVQVADQVEDDFAPTGQSVTNLFTPVFNDQDKADTLEGIAIVENESSVSTGRWQYLSGGGWTDVGVVSFTNSLILGKDDELRFVPVSNYIGPVDTLSIHAIDNTAGVPIVSHYSNSAFDSTGAPISNALSINSVSLLGEVLPQNDSPTIAPLVMLSSISEDELNPSGESLASLLSPGFNDIDAGQSLAGVAVVANSATANEGQWQYNISDSGWQSVGSVSPGNALMLSALDEVRFVP